MAGRDALRIMDAYCEVCEEVRPHTVRREDPGSCTCNVCAHVQLLMVPLDD
ncbi:MAG TPA: hypothetical protein VI796_03260 [Candidatus Thermoplasmatota archaeon]|nr:hypothetical protein [Candidatus Thermoplasmatota archaeon]